MSNICLERGPYAMDGFCETGFGPEDADQDVIRSVDGGLLLVLVQKHAMP